MWWLAIRFVISVCPSLRLSVWTDVESHASTIAEEFRLHQTKFSWNLIWEICTWKIREHMPLLLESNWSSWHITWRPAYFCMFLQPKYGNPLVRCGGTPPAHKTRESHVRFQIFWKEKDKSCGKCCVKCGKEHLKHSHLQYYSWYYRRLWNPDSMRAVVPEILRSAKRSHTTSISSDELEARFVPSPSFFILHC